MALGRKWRKTFQDIDGTNYRLDISQRDYTGASSDDIVLRGSPVVKRGNNDIYGFIKETRLEVVLSESSTRTYDDFSLAEDREYFGGLYYETSTAGVYSSVCEGWLIQQGVQRQFTSVPSDIRLTFYGGLAALQDLVSPAFTTTGTQTLLSYLNVALSATGLDYDVRRYTNLNSAIQGEFLGATTIDQRAFYSEDLTVQLPIKVAADQICTATNQRMYQGVGGVHYIQNNSSYTQLDILNPLSTSIDYLVTDHEGTAGTTHVEDPTLTVARGGTLIPVTRPISSTTTPGPTSIQYNVGEQRPKPLIPNGNFDLSGFGWESVVPLTFDTDTYFKGTRSISTTTFQDQDGTLQWVQSTAIPYSTDTGFTFSFKYLFQNHPASVSANSIRAMLVLVPADGTTTRFPFINQGNANDLPSQATAAFAYFDNGQKRWKGTFGINTVVNAGTLMRWDSDEFDTWRTAEIDIPSTLTPIIGAYEMHCIFFNPSILDEDSDSVTTGLGNAEVFIDDIQATPTFNDDDYNPVFERVQTGGNNNTIEYTSPITTVNRNQYLAGVEGQFLTGGPISGSLESIVTQWKLNDHRDALITYSGTLLSKLDIPLDLHNKLMLTDAGETSPLILDSLTHNVIDKTYQFNGHLERQFPSVTSTFFDRDVELTKRQVLDRGEVETVVVLSPRGTSNNPGSGNGTELNVTVEGESENVLAISPEFLEFNSTPGTIERGTFTVTPRLRGEHIVSSSNIQLFDTDMFPAPDGFSISSITDTIDGVQVSYQFSQPFTNQQVMTATIGGEVDPVTENTVSFNINLSSTDADGIITLPSVPVSGESGSVRTIQVPINPRPGRQLVDAGFTATTDTGVMNAGVVTNGSGLLWSISVAIPDTTPSGGLSAVATNVIDTARATNLADQTFILNFQEQAGGISNLSIATTAFPIHGPAGATYTHFRRANPAPGYRAVHGNDNTTSSNNTNAIVGDAIQDGDGYLIPITGSIPTNGGSATITLGYTGTVPLIGADVVTTRVLFGTTSLNNATIDEAGSEDYTNIRNSSGTNTLLVIPDQGRRFISANDVTIQYSGDVSGISKVLQPDGTVAVRYRITFGATSSTTGNRLAISGTAVNEPYQAVLNITETLPQGRLVTSTLTTRFSSSDTSLTFTGVTITPTEGGMQYPSGTTFTITGGTASNYSYSSGNVSFTLVVQLPTFNAQNPIGDVSLDVTISAAAPQLGVATAGAFTADIAVIPEGGGLPQASFTANGLINIVEGPTATGRGSAPLILAPIVSYTNNGNGMVRASGVTTGTRNQSLGFWLMYPAGVVDGTPLDSIEIFQGDPSTTAIITTLVYHQRTFNATGGTGAAGQVNVDTLPSPRRWALQSASPAIAGTFGNDTATGWGVSILPSSGTTTSRIIYTAPSNTAVTHTIELTLVHLDDPSVTKVVELRSEAGLDSDGNPRVRVVTQAPTGSDPDGLYFMF